MFLLPGARPISQEAQDVSIPSIKAIVSAVKATQKPIARPRMSVNDIRNIPEREYTIDPDTGELVEVEVETPGV